MIKRTWFLFSTVLLFAQIITAQEKATISIDAAKTGARIAPTLHGIFFEEISHAGEGGIYAELIQNRGFEENRLPAGTSLVDGFIVPERTPHFSMPNNGVSDWKMEWPVKSQWPAWSMNATGKSVVNLSLTKADPLNSATPQSLQIDIQQADPNGKADVANEGFWGINAISGDEYYFNFYARSDERYMGNITVSLQSSNGNVLATYKFEKTNSKIWKKYSCTLKPVKTDPKAKFVLSFDNTGTVWIDFVSLFPAKTFKDRPNGLRNDLAQYIADLKPAFIRWPGGCFVEGINIQSAPDWRNTIGPVEKRPGTYSPWGYWTSDGFGYDEYLQFCEDIHSSALYVFNAGVSCDFRSGTFIKDEDLRPYIQNALDAIEYAIGPADSKWGKIRVTNGHPKPYPLKYVEVGNEQQGPRYASRYNRFYTAIKDKFPGIQIMASMGIGDVNKYTLDSMRRVDYADEHAYKSAFWSMNNYDHFDKYKRGNYEMYVGEYATNNGVGSGNMIAALSDAVYIFGMERNSDLIKMSSYAPLLVNTNDVDWPVNLINFDASKSFARISYYAIKMLNDNRADVNLSTAATVTHPAVKQPKFGGGIGLSTWDTKTEYKDIEVIQNGNVVYKSDFINQPGDWQLLRGKWNVTSDSSLAQTAEGAQQFALLKNKTFDTYTLKLKGRKIDGYNAFIIPFAVKDSNTFLRAHIGSWVNQNSVFESVTNGYDVADITGQKKLPAKIEKGKWYDIRVEVGIDTVKCYLDDTLLMSYSEPAKVFAISGKDERNGDIILKVVNATSTPVEAGIEISNLYNIASNGELITLSASSPGAENSYETPKKTVPLSEKIDGISSKFKRIFPPYSLSILRIKQH
ncbi:MAG: alpha-L-arabinofuranosidase C-terminal domain-containing protein [Ferruginibacter sp.]